MTATPTIVPGPEADGRWVCPECGTAYPFHESALVCLLSHHPGWFPPPTNFPVRDQIATALAQTGPCHCGQPGRGRIVGRTATAIMCDKCYNNLKGART